MLKFSVKMKTTYDTELSYTELPDDLVEVSEDRSKELNFAVNQGCIIFDDLTYSEPRPSQFHVWNGSEWVDNRTVEEIAECNRSIMPQLKPIDFDIKLNNAGLYDAVQELIKDNFELRIAYNRATYFSRTDPFIDQARIALGLTNEQVDVIWIS